MMQLTKCRIDNELTLRLGGRLDSGNAAEVENRIQAELAGEPKGPLVLDLEELSYVSSAGLRVFLRLRKAWPELRIIGASSEVYEIFDLTGFVEILPIERAYRRVSVEGCEVIGSGANGEVYRLNPDTVIKVYADPNALPEIRRERELARKAFVLGIPTAIPYAVVRVGKRFGSVFELLKAKSLSELIAEDPTQLAHCVEMYTELLKTIHAATGDPGEMPDRKAAALERAERLQEVLPPETYARLLELIRAVPENNHVLHGDYHTKNILVQNGEALLIDMDTLCQGDPVFEFGAIYLAFLGFPQLDHGVTQRFLGIPYETGVRFWRLALSRYFCTEDGAALQELENRAALLANVRLLERTLRRDPHSPEGKAMIESSRANLIELVPKVQKLQMA